MKRGFLMLLLGSPFFAASQMLEAGDGVVEFNFGFPNVRPLTYDDVGNSHGFFEIDEGGNNHQFGQFIVKGEYFMSDDIGIASSFNYGYFYSFDEAVYQEYDFNTNSYIERTYFYESKVHKLRWTIGVNYHLVRTSRVDSYLGFQGGTKKVITSYSTNDPLAGQLHGDAIVPFALRVHYGCRFFFNEYLAANLELGLGGPLISFGASYKF